jgi:hypothetical protein
MSRKSRMKDIRQAKDRRAKRLAIGGVVVLAAVLAFEVPHVLKKSGGSTSSPPPAATTTDTTTGASASPATTAPATATAAAASVPATSTKLPNSDVAPRRLKSQLYSFSHFAGKDPFVQQVSPSDITSSATGAPAASSGGSGSSGSAASNNSANAASIQGASSNYKTTSAQRTLAQTGAATIEVNGKVQSVRIGASFPSSNPLFKLVSIAHGVARVGIASGSYASGAQTVSLAAGRSLTLVDTADGIRYKLELLSAS